MPDVKVKHIVSFSSEDAKNPAENILKPETYFKWKCETAGERQASLLLQLEKATCISGIDIGNNGSAFVEVLVGRSSWSSSEEFKVLLVASSFMTPAESKASKDIHRVRMFGHGQLVKSVAGEKWDQVKIICTQPYNQNESYGLSFFKMHTPEQPEEKSKGNVVQLGRFKLKSDSDDEQDVSTGSFFQRKMNETVVTPRQPKISMATAARKTSIERDVYKTKGESTSTPKQISVSHDKRHEVAASLLQGASDITAAERKPFPKMKDTPAKKKETPKRKVEAGANKQERPPAKKLKAERKRPKVKKKNVSYNKILDGVVFVLSGFENPERGNLRDQALTMGAKYEPGWNNRCTHLICAFANTPKFNQVKGKGKIVKKTWLKSCQDNKRRMNTKNFRMDGGGDSSYESSSSEEEEEKKVALPQISTVDSQSPPARRKSSSECDTEDELDKIRQLQKGGESNIKSKTECDKDPYGGTTEEESEAEQDTQELDTCAASLPELPDFFDGKSFFFFGAFDEKEKRGLRRFITAYAGTLEEYMSDSVNYVISKENWDDNFEQAQTENPSLIFIRPKWIHKCHEKRKIVPFEPFIIQPP